MLPFAMISTTTVIALCAVGVLLFGNRMPDLGRTLALTIRGFRDTLHGIEEDVAAPVAVPPQRLTPAPNAVQENRV